MHYWYGIIALKKDIDMLENVQNKATRLEPGVKLTTLEISRKREDLIEFYRVLNGKDSIEWKNNLVKPCQENTDGLANNLRINGCAFIRSQLM